jgi:tetratricopeptide (TPR) repeat protein
MMPAPPRPNPPPAAPLVGAQTQLIWHDPYDPQRQRDAIKLALLLALAAVAYLPALSAQFLWRDDQVITANESIRSLWTIGHVWLHPRSVLLWRPVADSMLFPQHALWRNWNPSGYHVISLLFHLINTALIWWLVRRLSLSGALAAAGLFALHPIAVHAVAWLSFQPVLLAAIFALLATRTWLRYAGIDPPLPEIDGAWNLSHRKWLLAGVSVAFLMAALLADAPTAAAVPIAWYMIAWWRYADRNTAGPFIAISAIVTAFIAWAHHSQRIEPTPGAPAMLLIAARGVCFHLLKLLIPHPLLLSYTRWDLAGPWAWSFPAIVIAGIVLLILTRRRLGRATVAAVVSFVVLLLPSILFFDPQGGGYVTDAQQYLARAALLIPIAAALAPLIPEPTEEGRHRATRPLVGVALAAALGTLTWRAVETCRNSEVAWSDVLRRDPDSRIAHTELGSLLLSAGNADRAADQFRQLVDADPGDADAQLRLGEVLAQRDDIAGAVAHFEKAAALRPRDPVPLRHLASAAAQRGDLNAAVERYQQALALDPRDDVSRNNLATLYARSGQTERALTEYDRALKDNPHATKTHLNLANLLFSMGRFDEAAAHLQEAVRTDPNNFDAYISAGGMLLNFKDFHNAARMFRAALHIRRDSAEAFNLLGVALAAQGELSEAIFNFHRALDLNPNLGAARQNLAAAEAQRGGKPPATTRSTS